MGDLGSRTESGHLCAEDTGGLQSQRTGPNGPSRLSALAGSCLETDMAISVPAHKPRSFHRGAPDLPAGTLDRRVAGIVVRHPAVGLAVAVVRSGQPCSFHGYGLADLASNTPISEDTVFRIGSITKLFTAIAIVQLWQRGLVDLDGPANDYLRSYRLIQD